MRRSCPTISTCACSSAPSGGAAMAETRDGRQPLCAVWPVTALPAVREALAGGAHPPTWQMLERIGARKVFFDAPEAFANINTRDDLAAVEAHGGARRSRVARVRRRPSGFRRDVPVLDDLAVGDAEHVERRRGVRLAVLVLELAHECSVTRSRSAMIEISRSMESFGGVAVRPAARK